MLFIQKLIKILLVAAGTLGLNLIVWSIWCAIVFAFTLGANISSIFIIAILFISIFLQIFAYIKLVIFLRRKNRSDNQIIFFGILVGTSVFALMSTSFLLLILAMNLGIIPGPYF